MALTVVTVLFSAYCGTLDRLRLHHARAGLRIAVQEDPQAFADSPVDPLPSTIDTPLSERVVNGGPSREVLRK
jgi:hypothetical protein